MKKKLFIIKSNNAPETMTKQQRYCEKKQRTVYRNG